MKSALNKNAVVALVLVVGVLLSSNTVFAQNAPYVNYAGGTFSYNAVSNELSISMGTIGWVQHVDGSYAFMPSQDPLHTGTFLISKLYNGDGAGENWIFAPSAGSPDFTIRDYMGNTRLTAEIYDFTVVQSGGLYEVNVGFNQHNIGAINTNTNTPYSEFISDVDSFAVPTGELYMKFNFTGPGAKDFTVNQSGTVTGTFSVVPEPVSSTLFLTGGAVFAFRRFRRKRTK